MASVLRSYTKLGVIVALLIAAFVLGLWLRMGSSGAQDESPGAPGIHLGLSKAAAAGLAQVGSTFPQGDAGLASYGRLSGTGPFALTTVPFARVRLSGGNWVVGVVPVTVYPDWDLGHPVKTVDVNVYEDTDGWLVAYLLRGQPSAAIVHFTSASGDPESPLMQSDTALDQALDAVVAAAGGSLLPAPRAYYDFAYPTATTLTLAAKWLSLGSNPSTGDFFSVVAGGAVSEESWSTVSNYYGDQHASICARQYSAPCDLGGARYDVAQTPVIVSWPWPGTGEFYHYDNGYSWVGLAVAVVSGP